MILFGAVPSATIITNRRLPYYGTTVLDKERERIPWTRTMLRVCIKTGKREYGPFPEEMEPVKQVERKPRELKKPRTRPQDKRELFVHFLCEERLPRRQAALRAGFSPASAPGLVDRAIRDGLIRRVAPGKYERVEGAKNK